jgi:hypothetical protein
VFNNPKPMKLKKYFLFTCLLIAAAAVQAQETAAYKYIDAQSLSKSGQWPKSEENYHRVQADDRQKLTKAVQTLSLNPAGISI